MTPTRTIPIARADPERLRLEADEAQMVRMAELQDHMFYNRLVNGMRERQAQSVSPAEKSKLMGKLPSMQHRLPAVSILMSQTTTPSFVASNSLISSSPADPLAMPLSSSVRHGDDFHRAQLSSILTQSLQVLEHVDDDDEDDELMFEMEF